MLKQNRAATAPSTRLLLSSKDAAAALGISERTLYAYTKLGLITPVYLPSTGQKQPTKLKRYAVTELNRFIASRSGDLTGDASDDA